MKEFISILKRFVPPYRRYLLFNVLFNILSAVLNIFSFALIIPILQILFKIQEANYTFIPWGTAELSIKELAINNFYYFVTTLIDNYGGSTTLLLLGLFLAGMTLLKTGAYFFASATMIPIRTGVVRDIRNQLYRKILSLPIGYFSEERKGDIMTRISSDVQEVENSIMASLDMLFKNPILIICYFATLVAINWQLTLFTVMVLPSMGWLMGKIARQLKKKSLAAQGQWSDTMAQIEETLSGLRIIKAFNAEKKMEKRFIQSTNQYRDTISKVNIRQQMAHPTSEFLGTVLIVTVLWFGGTLILHNNHTIDAATFIFYLVMLYSIINPLKEFTKAGYLIPKGLASMERIDNILFAKNSLQEAENPTTITSLQNGIEFRNVSFKYKDTWVLKDINLSIKKGKTIALVGQSGAGKSTLADLIPRFYDAQQGSVLIDGTDIKEISTAQLRNMMGIVSQEAVLFNDTFYNNIAFGVAHATKEQVENAAIIANAHTFITTTDKGYDTVIGDRGSKLSGGQRQRISIARAILKNPEILILDEATSALDTESERMVQDALEKLMKGRTTIAIAHRLSTIMNADEICVLHEGCIVERGKHQDLIALNGYYKKLCDMQQIN